MAVLYTNNAASNLSASITNTATSFSVTSGQGALFPAITGSDYFYVTLLDNSGNIEIVKVTARNTDTFTVTRAQDGTTARAWSANDKVELRITRSMLDDLKGERMPVYGPSVGSGGRVMINMSGNPAWSDANFTYDVIMGQFRATSFRANVGDSAPTWNFNNILHAGNYSSYALPLTGGALTGLTSITGGSFDTTYTSTQTRFADGGVQAMKTVDAGVFEAIRAVNLATTAGTTVRLVAAATSDAFNNTNGGKVFIDAVRTATNMDLVFSLNATAGAAPTERVRFFGGGGIQLDGTNTVLHSGNYSSYAAAAGHTHAYLPLSGGTLTGNVSNTGGMTAWNATTPGTGVGNYHIGASSATANTGGAITFGARDASSGANAQAGIYITSDGSYGTRMYLATTDSYVTGARNAVSISESGVVNVLRGALQQGGNQVLHAGNYTSYTDSRYMRYYGLFAGNWQTLVDTAGEVRFDQVNNITSGAHTNYPTGVYGYGTVISWRGDNHGFQLYASHTGDLAYKSQWDNDGYTGWQKILTSMNYTSYGDGRYVQKTGDTMTGALSFNVGGTSIFIGSQNVTTTNALRINWHTDSDLSYYIGKRAGTWTQPMDIAFYTGLRYHAHYSYGGHRFYTQGLDSNLAFSVGDGDNDVRLYSNLRITTATSPNTNYFLFGDNSGWIFRFMTNVSGTATERFRFSDQGAFNAVGAITQNGNQVLHAGNYTSYIGGGSYSGTTTITSATAGDTWNSTLTSTTLADKLTSRFTKTNTPPAGIQTNYIGGLAFNGKNYLGNSYEFATIVGPVLSASSLASGAYALGQIELNAYFFSSSLALSAGLKIGNSAFIFSGSGGQYLSIQSGGIVPTTSGTVSLGNSTQGFGQAYFQSVRLNNGWYENSKLLQFSGSLAANYNAMLAGPVTLDTGYTITIETGATLTIV